jgi:hypothetical protein
MSSHRAFNNKNARHATNRLLEELDPMNGLGPTKEILMRRTIIAVAAAAALSMASMTTGVMAAGHGGGGGGHGGGGLGGGDAHFASGGGQFAGGAGQIIDASAPHPALACGALPSVRCLELNMLRDLSDKDQKYFAARSTADSLPRRSKLPADRDLPSSPQTIARSV